MNKNAERGRATREQLVEIATRLFAEQGYEGTSIETVLREAGVSRGSLYHHFAGKDALFSAVLDGVDAGVTAKLAEAAKDAGDRVAALRIGCLAWLGLACDPVVQRIMLIDAPTVLGWQRWRELDERHTLGNIKLGLRAADVEPRLLDMYAHILLAALNETALLIARSADSKAATAAGQTAINRLLDGIIGS